MISQNKQTAKTYMIVDDGNLLSFEDGVYSIYCI